MQFLQLIREDRDGQYEVDLPQGCEENMESVEKRRREYGISSNTDFERACWVYQRPSRQYLALCKAVWGREGHEDHSNLKRVSTKKNQRTYHPEPLQSNAPDRSAM